MNLSSTKRIYRKFDEGFKREALNHWMTSGKSAETIAQELGINSNLLYAWKKRFGPALAMRNLYSHELGRWADGSQAEEMEGLIERYRVIRRLRFQTDDLGEGHSPSPKKVDTDSLV